MSKYTPTTLEVLSRYQEWGGGSSSDPERRAEFDRWLAERDEKIRRDQIEKDAAICQRIQDDPEFEESGPGVVAAKIVIRAQRPAIVSESTPEQPEGEKP